MENGIYLALVLLVGLWGAIHGFRRGITRQLAAVLGFAFGAVCSRVFTPDHAESFRPLAQRFGDPHFLSFISNLVCASTIYFVVYCLFSISSGILRAALSVFQVGMFNRLVGAFFSLTSFLLWLSIAFNLLLCLNPDSGLLRYEKSDDGNIVAAVMDMTPAILGCRGAADFAHEVQLREASTISCNFKQSPCVISMDSFLCNKKA